MMRPFWRYYGGKWRASGNLYPPPAPGLPIVEPFAGAAGYSTRHAWPEVVLVDRDPIICAVWRWLIDATPDDVMALPLLDMDHNADASVDDLDVPQAARWLIGFHLNSGVSSPCKTLSAWGRTLRNPGGSPKVGFCQANRERIASQVHLIRGWRVIEGRYEDAPDIRATWFIDPPYVSGGQHYRHGIDGISLERLSWWCAHRNGPTIVCESDGADWLPFEPVGTVKANSSRGKASTCTEVAWMTGWEVTP